MKHLYIDLDSECLEQIHTFYRDRLAAIDNIRL